MLIVRSFQVKEAEEIQERDS